MMAHLSTESSNKQRSWISARGTGVLKWILSTKTCILKKRLFQVYKRREYSGIEINKPLGT